MKSLEPNPLLEGRRPGERLVPIPFEEWDLIVPCRCPKNWVDAPGMPYDPGTHKVRTGKVVEWTPEEQEALRAAQARGDRVTVAQMMKRKQQDGD